MPASDSAAPCASAAAVVTGEEAPRRIHGEISTGWRASAKASNVPIIRSSKRNGEFGFTASKIAGFSRMWSMPPKTIAVIAMASSDLVRHPPIPMYGLSQREISIETRSEVPSLDRHFARFENPPDHVDLGEGLA